MLAPLLPGHVLVIVNPGHPRPAIPTLIVSAARTASANIAAAHKAIGTLTQPWRSPVMAARRNDGSVCIVSFSGSALSVKQWRKGKAAVIHA